MAHKWGLAVVKGLLAFIIATHVAGGAGCVACFFSPSDLLPTLGSLIFGLVVGGAILPWLLSPRSYLSVILGCLFLAIAYLLFLWSVPDRPVTQWFVIPVAALPAGVLIGWLLALPLRMCMREFYWLKPVILLPATAMGLLGAIVVTPVACYLGRDVLWWMRVLSVASLALPAVFLTVGSKRERYALGNS